MTGPEAFIWGFIGGLIAEAVSIRKFQYRVIRRWPEALRTPAFWFIAAGLSLAGGAISVAYAFSGFDLQPIIALNVGLTFPFFGEGGGDKLLPKPDLGPVD